MTLREKIETKYKGYFITQDGDVYSLKSGEIKKMKPLLLPNGYLQVQLSYGVGNRIIKTVHRLVAETLIDNPLNKEQVNHIDGNKINNHISNLEWVTGSENCQHAFRIGLSKPSDIQKNAVREKCRETGLKRAKLSKSDIEYIQKNYIPRDKDFGSIPLAIKFNVCRDTINTVAHKRGHYGH